MMAASRLHSGVWLSDLLQGIVAIPVVSDLPVQRLVMDSRKAAPDSLFCAVHGSTAHGLEFLSQALEQGVAAVIYEPTESWSETRVNDLLGAKAVTIIPVPDLGRKISEIAGRFYAAPAESLQLFGFTGTNGKTSCTQFLAQALDGRLRCGVIGTLGSGFLGALETGEHTTPDPIEVQASLARIRDAGGQAVAMEVSSHALDQGRVESLVYDIAVLTNISRDHLDYHGTMDHYIASKHRLFYPEHSRCAVLNLDDPVGRQFAESLNGKQQVIAYGFSEAVIEHDGPWLRVTSLDTHAEGMTIAFDSHWGRGMFNTPLLGAFNASNLAAVLVILLHSGMAREEAVQRVSSVETVPGRMERFSVSGQPIVIVDFAHTPDALQKTLKALRPHLSGRLLVVFGCGGERDRGKRPEMGAIAESLADRLFITNDNPRREPPGQIIGDILAGLKSPEDAEVIPDRRQAIQTALESAQMGDLILVAGKGHETYQIIGSKRMAYSDRETVRELLGGAT